jgi:hypothetical protein
MHARISSGGRPTGSTLVISDAAGRFVVALTLACALLFAFSASDAQAQVGAAAGEWTAPTTIDPWFYPSSISCPTASFCVAVGPTGEGTAATFDGSKWSPPTSLGIPEGATAVSCSSASFCVAVGGRQALAFNGSSWSAPAEIGTGRWFRSVSCASATFCVAVDNAGEAVTYDGSSWGQPVSIDYPERLVSVSCPSASFCMAVDSEGYAVRYDGTSWGAPAKASGYGFNSVSCASASLCIGSTQYDEIAYVYDGSAWGNSTPPARLESVFCYSSSFCVGVGEGEAVTYDGSSWGGATKLGAEAGNVACASPSFCMSVGYTHEDAIEYDGASWGSPVAIGGRIASLSCPTSGSCVAVDDTGRALAFDGESWSAPEVVDGVIPLRSVSCPTESFCMAIDEAGQALGRVAGVWQAPAKVDSASTLTSISCAASSFCAAVDRDGNAFMYENGSWSERHKIDEFEGGQGMPLSSISCPSTTSCVAVDEWGRILTYATHTWSTPDPVDTWGFTSVSCRSQFFCAVADWRGQVRVGAGTSWGSGQYLPIELPSVSCPSNSTCVAVGWGQAGLAGVDHGYVDVFAGGVWNKSVDIDQELLKLVSCASEAFCVALDSDGNVLMAGEPSRRSIPFQPPLSAAPQAPEGGASSASPFGKAKVGGVQLHGSAAWVHLGCAGPSTAACQVTVTLRGHADPHRVQSKSTRPAPAIVGRASVSLRGGQEKTARIKLSGIDGDRRLDRPTLSLKLVAEQTEGGKTLVVSHRVVRLRLPSRGQPAP